MYFRMAYQYYVYVNTIDARQPNKQLYLGLDPILGHVNNTFGAIVLNISMVIRN